MENSRQHEVFDLLLVLDATASMGAYAFSLYKSLPEIVSLCALTGCFERIGVLAYRDYCDRRLTEWSGWCSPSNTVSGPDIVSQEHVRRKAASVRVEGGGDAPEATKTAFAHAYQEMRAEATTVILLYSDAPPHLRAYKGGSSNAEAEKQALEKPGAYGGTGHLFADWVSAANTFKTGRKRGIVFSLVSGGGIGFWSSHLYLSTVTGGALFCVAPLRPETISQSTLSILLAWMGEGKSLKHDQTPVGLVKWYSDTTDIERPENEESAILDRYLTVELHFDKASTASNILSSSIAVKDIPASVRSRGPSVPNFAKRYVDDDEYKKQVIAQLRYIIASNVSAISVNPVFGTLWRTVCNDRTNDSRDGLVASFGLEVDRIADAHEKARMKAWLEESYNYAAEIQELIAKVPPEERFPVVFLDPTTNFETPASENHHGDGDGSKDEGIHHSNEFTRAELLDIGRSCDYQILRRLGTVLTRLTYVEKPEDLPTHIRNANADETPQIPMALADPKHKRVFWRILLHTVLPGTMLTARPAAVLAALSLRMGILPLRDSADKELLAFKDKWNTLDVPETWNTGCLGLLLDADKDYKSRVGQEVTQRTHPEAGILREGDCKLFKILIDYKMLEMNRNTTLQAEVGWRPDKTKTLLGPTVVCQKCRFPRSVTMMAEGGICGYCATDKPACHCAACLPTEDHAERLEANVSKEDSESSLGYWVECRAQNCRAQYVVYSPDALRVSPKCYYCRHQQSKSVRLGAAPTVECCRCLSRVIWPVEYRPESLDLNVYECPACTANVTTIVKRDTSVNKLASENDSAWILRNEDMAIAEPFNGRSLFYTASHCDLANLADKVEVLPAGDTSKVTIDGKLIHNLPELKTSLASWVLSRRTQSGICSLCFSNSRKTDLRSACGRTGCRQAICNECRGGWYGINARGRIINVAALSCPFCRRRPAPKAVAASGLAHMGGLRTAVEDAGSWIYAWCAQCGLAKRYVERVCAAGAPPELTGWTCDECRTLQSAREGEKLIAKSVECPGCGVATEKTGGCDHISCPCGAHWCYGCGERVAEDQIYAHISKEHGGLWAGYDEAGEYEDDDEGW